MAQRIEGPYDFSRHGFQAYADGATWLLTEGEDFRIQPQSWVNAARAWARVEGLDVQLRINDGAEATPATEGVPATIAVRFIKPPELRRIGDVAQG